jgi:hypothetical protein
LQGTYKGVVALPRAAEQLLAEPFRKQPACWNLRPISVSTLQTEAAHTFTFHLLLLSIVSDTEESLE